MLDKEFDELVHYLEGMIADGVQLIHGGHLIDWQDTNVLDLLGEINKKKEAVKELSYKSGDLLKNRYTGQKVAVVNDFGDKVMLILTEETIKHPIDTLWYHYEKSEPGD